MNAFEHATERLFELLTGPKPEGVERVIAARDEVIGRFAPLFTPERAREIKDHEFAAFLRFENNKHWTQLSRARSKILSDMHALRENLALLVDASEPLAHRVTTAKRNIHGMGKAIVTAVLHVAHPHECGVWNTTSELGLKTLDLWPDFERGLSFGEKYDEVNDVLVRLADEVDTDLWTLDALWTALETEEGTPRVPFIPSEPTAPSSETHDDTDVELAAARFGLERHLQDFLRDNWASTPLGEEWALYADDTDDEAGYEYPTKAGRIDLLATHRTEPRWLVIELKRAQTSDETVGQVLRYMGAIRRELAQDGDQVEGRIIALDADDKLRYAVSEIPSVDVQLYEVEFRLRDDDGLDR